MKGNDKMSLIEQVRDKLSFFDEATGDNREALRHASELADLFADVEPQVSTIPLDAMAGFPVSLPDKNTWQP